MNTSEIEEMLRHAPRPGPPAGLEQKLIDAATASRAPRSARSQSSSPPSWLKRWWPALAASAVSAACAATFALQQLEIRSLEETNQILRRAHPETATGAQPDTGPVPAVAAADPAAQAANEVERLKTLIARLQTEISQLEQLQSENEKLRAQLSKPSAEYFSPEDAEAFQKARERAMRIQCINHLKQLALAARVWALDNHDLSPPNILDMTNEMATPKILICPADTTRQAAESWTAFSDANCSYEYLAPSTPSDLPTRILFRCPVHGNIALVDGSVQSGVSKSHPEWIVERDGKLFFEPKNAP